MARVNFRIPSTVQHDEVGVFMRNVVKKLNAENTIDVTDIPQLHRMATSYDDYLTACDWIAENGAIMTNVKGEKVKHPYANLQKESWNQFLVLSNDHFLSLDFIYLTEKRQ